MTPEEIQTRLAGLREMDFGGAERLARDIARDARAPLRALQKSVAWVDNPDRGKAESLLRMLDELATPQWLVAARRLRDAARMAALIEATRGHERLEHRILQTLRAMLTRRTRIPPPFVPGTVERPAPVVRECDEAFLLMRRLLRPDEEDPDYQEQAAEFVALSEPERDRLIERALAGAEPEGPGAAGRAEDRDH